VPVAPAVALITQRSLVQIQPPQPGKTTGYGRRRSPLGFSGNVRLEIPAPNLVVRIQMMRRFTDNPGPHCGQPDPDEPIAPAQRGPRCRLVHGERLAQGEVLESELTVAVAEGRTESEPVELRADHGTAIVSRSEPKDQPLAHRMEFWRRTGCDPKADVFSGR
jgi:hypothetical protein